ncbi:MAG: histidine kinase, partial [Gemmatimonadaceae bacterium]
MREQEQAHLSRELHDRLGHSLTMLKPGLVRLTDNASAPDIRFAERVQQYASAHAVTLRLSEQEYLVCLEISDDGIG